MAYVLEKKTFDIFHENQTQQYGNMELLVWLCSAILKRKELNYLGHAKCL